MPGFDNGTMYADNVDFSGATNPTPTVTLDGQMLIGSSVAPFLKPARIQNGTNITWTFGHNSARADVAINPTFNSLVTINGGIQFRYTPTAVSYNVLVTDVIIGVTSTAAVRTITMPAVGSATGQWWIIKDESGAAATNNITVAAGTGTIDGAANVKINSNFGSVTVYFNGTNYFVV